MAPPEEGESVVLAADAAVPLDVRMAVRLLMEKVLLQNYRGTEGEVQPEQTILTSQGDGSGNDRARYCVHIHNDP